MQVQLSLLGTSPPIQPSDYAVGQRESGGAHGVVLTKPHVVEMILDLVQYSEEEPLYHRRLLEPSCGEGAFLAEVSRRLARAARRDAVAPSSLRSCIVAFDIDGQHVAAARTTVATVLETEGVARYDAEILAASWIHEGDFLLSDGIGQFDFIVGNPPYVRIEQLSARLLSEYRSRFATLFDRADLYVAFIERSLSLLAEGGALSFICADRWISNKYGGPLRRLISSRYAVQAYIDLHTTSPFEAEVIAYPSIFVIGRGQQTCVSVARMDCASALECAEIARLIVDKAQDNRVERHDRWFDGDEPWVLTPLAHLKALRSLEAAHPVLEEHASVGIGVATGADRVYIVDSNVAQSLEEDRVIPLVMRSDIVDGKIEWSGKYVINVFDVAGGCVTLSRYPHLSAYLEQHREAVLARHVAKKNAASWYRTIDRVYPELVQKPKLLIPDIAGANEVVLDPGGYHPHHNLYFVTSSAWDLEVLGGLLSSKVALFFVWSYAVKMRGSYLRFQAQYLRRIRVPSPNSIVPSLKLKIAEAFRARDFDSIDRLALQAYGIDDIPEFDFVDTRSRTATETTSLIYSEPNTDQMSACAVAGDHKERR